MMRNKNMIEPQDPQCVQTSVISIPRITNLKQNKMENNILTPEIKDKLISWCKAEKYSQGDNYNCYVNTKGKFVVGYSNDYPMQHGKGKDYILTDEEFTYAMNRPLTEIELMEKFWYPKTMDERQKLCDKYFNDKIAMCLWDGELIHIFKAEAINHKV
ncbi:hypothetical protein H4V97_001089 [Flavobacterium sp. CG_23.5]|uniref:hypothetical protein n=1 Tax=Flavobacterium sp. CG_23.5 TaxID=2760708 RepID=UPI001AEA6906|nr:hypothetical protein [Flavobacterium sp. CG_23.5]MBP2282771.1 hypothetical protein [Flavobacterium sp. CG_23.5]